MNKNNHPNIFITSIVLLFTTYKICFAAELPENQRSASLTGAENHIPFSQTNAPSLEIATHQDQGAHYPAIQEINKQLHQCYELIHPNIQLSPATYDEISHISKRYESSPIDIFYNHRKNQVRLVWETDKFISVLRQKKKTFDLAEAPANSATTSGITLAEIITLGANNEASGDVNTPSAVERINNELRACYGLINPSIKLSRETYAEIAHLSMRYESDPEDILYNHLRNQVRLIWKNHVGCSLHRILKRTYELAKIDTTKSAKRARNVVTQTSPKPVTHTTSNNRASNIQHKPTKQPADYLKPISAQPEKRTNDNPTTGVHYSQLAKRKYALTQENAVSVFNQWFNGLDPRYKGPYVETSEYNRLISDLKKYGIATLEGFIENGNNRVLVATWPNQQKYRYQLWGIG